MPPPAASGGFASFNFAAAAQAPAPPPAATPPAAAGFGNFAAFSSAPATPVKAAVQQPGTSASAKDAQPVAPPLDPQALQRQQALQQQQQKMQEQQQQQKMQQAAFEARLLSARQQLEEGFNARMRVAGEEHARLKREFEALQAERAALQASMSAGASGAQEQALALAQLRQTHAAELAKERAGAGRQYQLVRGNETLKGRLAGCVAPATRTLTLPPFCFSHPLILMVLSRLVHSRCEPQTYFTPLTCCYRSPNAWILLTVHPTTAHTCAHVRTHAQLSEEFEQRLKAALADERQRSSDMLAAALAEHRAAARAEQGAVAQRLGEELEATRKDARCAMELLLEAARDASVAEMRRAMAAEAENAASAVEKAVAAERAAAEVALAAAAERGQEAHKATAQAMQADIEARFDALQAAGQAQMEAAVATEREAAAREMVSGGRRAWRGGRQAGREAGNVCGPACCLSGGYYTTDRPAAVPLLPCPPASSPLCVWCKLISAPPFCLTTLSGACPPPRPRVYNRPRLRPLPPRLVPDARRKSQLRAHTRTSRRRWTKPSRMYRRPPPLGLGRRQRATWNGCKRTSRSCWQSWCRHGRPCRRRGKTGGRPWSKLCRRRA